MEYPFVDIHTHKTGLDYPFIYSFRIGVDDLPPATPYSAGVHPWDADIADDNALAGISRPGLVAIGEIGLDFAAESSRQMQFKWFERQLMLAQELGLPVVIHCVKAYNELLEIIKGYSQPVIIHGFTGSPQLASQLLAAGCYLSFGENLLRSPKTAESFGETPLERLFFETDTWPGSVEEIYNYAAEGGKRTLDELKEAVYMNYIKLFPIR